MIVKILLALLAVCGLIGGLVVIAAALLLRQINKNGWNQ